MRLKLFDFAWSSYHPWCFWRSDEGDENVKSVIPIVAEVNFYTVTRQHIPQRLGVKGQGRAMKLCLWTPLTASEQIKQANPHRVTPSLNNLRFRLNECWKNCCLFSKDADFIDSLHDWLSVWGLFFCAWLKNHSPATMDNISLFLSATLTTLGIVWVKNSLLSNRLLVKVYGCDIKGKKCHIKLHSCTWSLI